MSTNPWGGGIGAWAAEAERAEAEELEAAAAEATAKAESSSQSYPSLKEAVSGKPKKKKMTLSEFTMATYSSDKALTRDEILRLPTGPKERSAEEMQYGRLGGGFPSYGRSGSSAGRGRDREDGDGSWGGGARRSYGGFDDERRGQQPSARVSDFDQPSRADEVDNWALTKKPLPSLDSGRQNRYGSLGGGSRADEVDTWTVGKKPLPSRSSTFGSGFRESGQEPDRWTRGAGGGGFRDSERERPRLVLDPRSGDSGVNEPPVKTNRTNPFGAARPREDILAEKGLDYKKLELEFEAKKASVGTPTSAHSSRPSSAQSSRSDGQGLQQGIENVVKPRPKVNPFGDAKPREVLLEERGQDWRKIELELEHRRVDRSLNTIAFFVLLHYQFSRTSCFGSDFDMLVQLVYNC